MEILNVGLRGHVQTLSKPEAWSFGQFAHAQWPIYCCDYVIILSLY